MRNPREFRSNKGKGGTHLHLKIRLMKLDGTEPTEDEAERALFYVLRRGRAPAGWEYDVVNWQHPKSGGVSNDVSDLQRFRDVIREVASARELQFAITRK